jgi:hypothetical protein
MAFAATTVKSRRRLFPRRHCERSEAIQGLADEAEWISSLHSQ